MAFSNGFNGDQVTLPVILQTLEAKSILIPGVIANPNLKVSVGGEVASYYVRGAASTGTGTVGSQLTYGSTGVTRQDVNLTTAIQIKAVLPHVNFATVQAPVVADKVVQETLSAANTHNTLGLAYLEANVTKFFKTADDTIVASSVLGDNTALLVTTIYDEIVDMRTAFNVANKAKGMKPTGIIISERAYGLLLKSDEFIRKEQSGSTVVFDGMVGTVAGLPVIVSPDMKIVAASSGVAGEVMDIIMLNAEAFAAPTNVNTLVIADGTAAGYPAGTIIGGEIGYGFSIGDADLVLARTTHTDAL